MASRALLASNLVITIVVIIMPACENYSYEIQTHKEYLSGNQTVSPLTMKTYSKMEKAQGWPLLFY